MRNAQPAVAVAARPNGRPGLQQPGQTTATDVLRPVVTSREMVAKPSGPDARTALIEQYLALAYSLARRYANSGQPLDDLRQVASVGLVKSVDGFDPDRGVRFEAYAIPTILGELKRYHRDHAWSLRVPRRLQEQSSRVREMVPLIAQDLKRSPTIAEIAEHAHLSEEEVLEAMDAQDAYASMSLDAPFGNGDGGATLNDRIAADGAGFDTAEGWADVGPLLRALPGRERKIVILRFFHDWTQSQIAQELGISQMHVSRLLSRSLQQLRSTYDVETR